MAANVHRSPERQHPANSMKRKMDPTNCKSPSLTPDKKKQKQSHRTGQGQALAEPAPKLVCYVYDEVSHRGSACPEPEKVKRLVKECGQAHNAAVTSTDPPADATNQDADGGL
ncbi:unnamed protein product [Phytophthora fragariaefolia]|uniref:Unnamed protein product n=1 Tax=Phytophthora fragariaefolia TaxID=1490495 RepID=A0A9W6Y3I7_9STRA|nr:unnamed protein product [Phytophthora fragariaefolia]